MQEEAAEEHEEHPHAVQIGTPRRGGRLVRHEDVERGGGGILAVLSVVVSVDLSVDRQRGSERCQEHDAEHVVQERMIGKELSVNGFVGRRVHSIEPEALDKRERERIQPRALKRGHADEGKREQRVHREGRTTRRAAIAV
jgi:hypothetical protein